MDELRRSLEGIKQDVKLIQNDLNICAKSADLNMLTKYLSFWEPLNFMTEEGVKQIVKEIIQNRKI